MVQRLALWTQEFKLEFLLGFLRILKNCLSPEDAILRNIFTSCVWTHKNRILSGI